MTPTSKEIAKLAAKAESFLKSGLDENIPMRG